MIIHNPKISGSLQFPSDENGNLITLQVQNGTLETITLNSSGVDQGIQPAVNYSGSFTGSFVGDGSNLTGVAASDFNIDILDALGGASIAQSDNFLISDAGTEKKVSFTNIEDSIFANVSGDISIAAGGASTLASIANSKLANSSITIDGSVISLGGSVTTTNTQLSTEAVQDIAGALVATGGTKTGIAVTYDDDNGNMDFVVTFPSQTDENFTTADHSKLDGIEASADVTDTSNVTAAGALMDSELTDLAGVKGVTISTLQVKPSEGAFADGDKTKLDGIAASANNYSLPTNLAGDDIDIDTTALSGATVISDLDLNITTNTSGLVTDANGSISTRDLTPSDLGLGNVDNTSDANKPVSTAQQTEIDTKADLASPALTGNPTAPTQADNDNSTKIATTAYVQREVSDLLGGAPAAFDTLLEISASIANGDSDVVALTTTVGGKLQKDQNLSDLTNASTARTNLGVAIGSDVQAFNSTLATVAGGTYAGDNSIVTIGTVTTGDVQTILPSGVVSGSSQVQALGGVNNNTITFSAGAGLDGGGAITLNQGSDETVTFTVGDGVVSGSDQVASTFAQTILDDTSAGAVRTTIGVDAAGTDNSTDVTLAGSNFLSLSGQEITAGTVDISSHTNLAVSDTDEVNMILSGDTLSAELIGGVISGSAQVSIDSSQISDVAAFSQSGTYASLRAQGTTKGDVGLGNVTNESKSTMFTSPTFTGTTAAPTPSSNDDSTKIATTAYVQQELTDLVGTAGSTLDTLGELSASLASDQSGLASLTTTVGTKLAKASNLSDLTNAGTARTNLGVDAAGTDNSTDVTLGNTNYLSISGQEITGGTVPVGSGGTGATSAGAARTALGVDAAGTDNSTDVTVAGNTYISLSGQEITAGTVDISSHTNLAVSDTTEVNMILSGDTLSAELIGGVVSGSSQITSIGNSQLSNSSITIDGSAISLGGSITTNNTQLSTEQVQDIVGGMVSSNTESGISVTYDDTGNSLDFSVTSQTDENFTTDDHSKLDGIEAGAEVNRTAAETRTLIGTGNGNLVPAAGSSGEFLKHDGTFGTPSYTTNTNTQLTQEQVEDFVGGMLDGTETGISVGYDDTNGNIDFVVASQTDNNFTTTLKNKLDGIAASANNYVLPTNLAGDDIDIDTTALTGATVISDLDINITTNTSGLVTDANGSVSTRTLTASDLGLGNVTNESKSTMFTSPTFTGTTVAPTPSADDNSTKIATTAYVQGELTALIGTAPATLDTLGEISASIANGDSDVVALTTTVGTKLAKSSNLSDLANASTARTNLGVDAAGTINYTHPTFDGDDISVDTGALTGATVISDLDFNITTNSDGHVTDANGSVSTRTLTAGNLGLGSGDDVTFGTLRIDDATASTSKTEGALIVDGGVGIGGALNVGGDVVAYASSDERLKDNIELISNPIEKVQSLKGVTWNWNDNADELQQSLPNVGVIAQDVEKVLPQLVTDRDNGFKGVDYAKLTGLLIEAVKDQQKQIDELKSKLS
jgi:hypothetical protein